MSKESMDSPSIDIDSLLAAMATSEENILARLNFLDFTDQDAEILASLHQAFASSQDELADAFYSYLNSFAELRPILGAANLAMLKRQQSAYFSSLTGGCYGKEYVRNRIMAGLVHQRIGLKPEWYLGAYKSCLDSLMPVLWRITGNDFSRFTATFAVLTKIMFFDIGIALDTYFAVDKMIVMPERKLKESERRFNEIFNRSDQGIAHLMPDGRIIYANDKLCTILGYPRAELIGRRLADVYCEAGPDRNSYQNEQLPADLPLFRKFEKQYFRRDGQITWTQLTISPVLNADGNLSYLQLVVEDISERKSIEGMLHLKDRALASSSNGILIADATKPSFPIIFANPGFCRITGYTAEEVLGRNCRFLQNEDTDQPELATIRLALTNQHDVHVIVRNYRKDGSLFFNDLFISPVPDENGKLTHFIGILSDITEQKRDQERLAFQKTHDDLTGLPNHSLLMSRLQNDVQLAQQKKCMVALLIVDIDHFKLINDGIGHDAGDCLIKEFANRLRSCLQADDTVSRHSGDEFALILTGISEMAQVSAICENILHIIAAPFFANDQELHLTCSIGVALCPQDGTDPVQLSKYANMARYRAKELGRNNFQFYFQEMNDRVLERVTLESALRSAVAKAQLDLMYQPLVDFQSGQVIGLEALLCWQHPELGIIAPSRFIPVAEECGLIDSIGEWVLKRACLDLRTWIDKGIRVPHVAINVSPRQFRDPLLTHKIGNALSELQIDPGMISLEITEGVLMADAASSDATLRELKRLGVTLSLDDFGTGYSSPGYLKRFPFHRVKIDQSFVHDVTVSQYDAAIANSIISMAHSIGIKVIAEGVETEAQCEFLSNNMCDEMQGYFFSRPLSRENLEVFLREDRRLPPHLLRLHKPPRTLLLVDDEPNILASLKRLLRRDGYQILTASSGMEGLDMLGKNKVDIILSDQRMPGMTGVEFLRTAKGLSPDTVRIVLSGYTELQSVTDAINEGAVYRFLTKPWDDQQLRGYIEEAFQHKELVDENRRLNLTIRTANQELATTNRRLEEVLKEKQQQIARDEVSLDIVREALQHIQFPVIGVDDDGMIAFVNTAASTLFMDCGPILGSDVAYTLPVIDSAISRTPEGEDCINQIGNQSFRIKWHRMGEHSKSRGKLVTLTKCEREP